MLKCLYALSGVQLRVVLLTAESDSAVLLTAESDSAVLLTAESDSAVLLTAESDSAVLLTVELKKKFWLIVVTICIAFLTSTTCYRYC